MSEGDSLGDGNDSKTNVKAEDGETPQDTASAIDALQISDTPVREAQIPSIKVEEQSAGDEEEVLGGDVEFKADAEGRAILARKPKVKRIRPEPIILSHLPSAKEEASMKFQELEQCHYQPGYLGDSGQEESMSCDCKPEYGPDGINHACGPESDCINRSTLIECTDEECNCGDACQNQRFQLREYADIDVINAGKKGYGLRAGADFPQNIFVYEYVGEVIGEKRFRQRQIEYKEQGEKHFYFMMLRKGEYIDATRKGGYGRFINHSCEPNCYVDKWVVGKKMRMGIFTKRSILKGEELTFDYNVDRYGGDATPCYCGEPTCLGYIGGKTQTEAANKLSQNVAEALGLDEDDDWDEAKPKKNRRRKKGEDDEEYVNDLTPRSIKEADVPKIMATLLQASERWLLRKLLQRISNDGDEKIQAKIVLLHGYQTLGAKLEKWKEDSEICILILQILQKWPSMTKNKISSSKIETYVTALAAHENSTEEVKELSNKLLETWGNLEMAYRIPRRVRPPKPEIHESTKKDEESAPVEKNSSQVASISKDTRSRSSTHTPVRRDQPWRKQDQSYNRFRDQNRTYNGQIPPRGPSTSTAVQQPNTPTKIDTVNQDLQAIIDAATKKQQEQAELLKKQEMQKVEEEAARLKAEALKRADRARRHVEHKAEKEKRSLEKRMRQKDKKRPSKEKEDKRAKPSGTNEDEKKLERILAKFVPNVISKYQQALGKEQFKKRAKELVKLLVAKEMKKAQRDTSELSDQKKHKIKAFSRDFIEKLIARQRNTNGAATSDNTGAANDETGEESDANAEVNGIEGSPNKVESAADSSEMDSPSDEEETPASIYEPADLSNGSKRQVLDDSISDDRAAKREKLA